MREFYQEKNSLLRRIEGSFSEAPYPGDGKIFVLLDPQDVDFDELDYNAFRGLHWTSLNLDFLSQFDMKAVLSYLTKEAFRFYLPGFMTVIVNSPLETEENGMRLALVCAMTPSKIGDQNINSERRELLSSFTQNQRAVFRAFLEFMNAHFPYSLIEIEALESSWWQGK